MKTIRLFLAGTLLGASLGTTFAHPASGIVVDDRGQIYFIYTSHGVYKIDAQGALTCVMRVRAGGHWLCLDPQGAFAHAQPRHFQRITPDGITPAIIYADGGAPIAVLPDGNLYYVCSDDSLNPGGLRLARNSPGGALSLFAPEILRLTKDRGITGLACGPHGTLYVACPNAVLKLESDGKIVTVADPIRVPGCEKEFPDSYTNIVRPYLRGLAVDPQGTVYAAATSCHCVLKISTGGNVEKILESERPWTPTGVAEWQGAVYVLEYTHAAEDGVNPWVPRIRRIARDGTVTTLVTLTPELKIPDEPFATGSGVGH